ncbi:hypothetical protein MUP38_08590 [Candidatus Bathyarchaeota archaeon]|nr:hypothetical protein [Candidatus Bathyarchaeota archaeon]
MAQKSINSLTSSLELYDPSGLRQNQAPDTADIILEPTVSHNNWVSFGCDVASGDLNGDEISDIVVGDRAAFHLYGGTAPGVQTGGIHIYLSKYPHWRESLKFDFGSLDSPVANGYIRVTESNLYSESVGYGWAWTGTEGLISNDRGGADYVRRDFVQQSGFTGLNYTFCVDLPNGDYRVKLVVGDSNQAHGPMDVIDPYAGEKCHIDSLAQGEFQEPTFTTTVKYGQLAIQFPSLSRGTARADWVINALIISPV